MEVINFKNVVDDASYGFFGVFRSNFCYGATAIAGCKNAFPDLFVHTQAGGAATYQCGACLANFQPVVAAGTTIYFNSASTVALTSTTLVSQSPVQTFPAVTCVAQATFFSTGTTSAVVANCDYYYSRISGFYSCYRCQMGFSGALFNPAGVNTGGQPGGIASCSTAIPNCSTNYSFEIFTNTKAEVGAFGTHLGALFSCKVCTPPNTIPYIAIDLSLAGQSVPRYSLFTLTGSQASVYTSGFVNTLAPVACYANVAASFNIAPANYQTVTNCGLGVINVGSIPNSSKANNNVPTAGTVAVYCFACAPGFAPSRVTPAVTFAPLMAHQCNPITNCQASTWFNACSQCASGSTYLWDPVTQNVDFDQCITSSIPNCFALDTTGNPAVCIICNVGYNLNRDGYCEMFTAPNCQDTSLVFNRTFNISFAADQHSIGLFMLAQGVGCQSCATGYVGWNVTNTQNNTYCTLSPFLATQPWIANATSSFPAQCLNYGYDTTQKRIVCRMCTTGNMPTLAGSCMAQSQLSNCLLANTTVGVVCVNCATNFVNVNGVCQARNIANCLTWADSSKTTSQSCSVCASGYYAQGAQCIKGSIGNCLVYQSQRVCTQCATSFSVVSASDSMTYCFPLPAAQNCLTVDNTFGSGSFTCTNCATEYAISTTVSLISPTICLPIVTFANCGSYDLGSSLATSKFTCNNCTAGFFLSAVNTCTVRTIQFRQCAVYNITADLCSSCIAGHFLSIDNTTCIAYPTGILGCVTYVSALNCTRCDKGLFFNGTFCNPVPSNQTILNCDYYKDNKTCTTCANNYALISNTCVASSAINCLTWASTTSCGSCFVGYGFLTTGGIRNCVAISDQQCITYAQFSPFSCSLCKPGYFPSNGVCTAVTTTIQFCVVYDSATTCVQCDSTSILNPARTQCLKTLAYFGFFDPSCSFMAILTSPACNKCAPNFYFMNGTCTACPVAIVNQGCYSCNPINTSNCLACQKGFYQQMNGTCVDNNFVSNTTNGTNGTNGTNNTPTDGNKTNYTPSAEGRNVWSLVAVASALVAFWP
jgi:hypothetical protein